MVKINIIERLINQKVKTIQLKHKNLLNPRTDYSTVYFSKLQLTQFSSKTYQIHRRGNVLSVQPKAIRKSKDACSHVLFSTTKSQSALMLIRVLFFHVLVLTPWLHSYNDRYSVSRAQLPCLYFLYRSNTSSYTYVYRRIYMYVR